MFQFSVTCALFSHENRNQISFSQRLTAPSVIIPKVIKNIMNHKSGNIKGNPDRPPNMTKSKLFYDVRHGPLFLDLFISQFSVVCLMVKLYLKCNIRGDS